jgi:pyruvate/2-oxoglutarate dehydrogenase complex dihydrolipoamide dehydrogenase (E3) component
VIATGSKAAIPTIEGLDSVPVLTNANLFALDTLPSHLLIIGAGPIGLEMAQAFRRLGAEVSVFDAGKALGKDDREATRIVVQALRDEGVRIEEGARIMRALRHTDGVGLVIGEGAGEHLVSGSHLLLATGRKPVTEGMDLEVAGVRHSAQGIEVDHRLRTSNRRIFAVGDVLGGLLFTHAANYHAGVVLKNALFRLPGVADPARVPWCTYTDPPLAKAGLSEEKARNLYGDIRVLRWPFAENDRAVTEGDVRGFIKVITSVRGRVLGAVIVGRGAGDLIGLWSLAAAQGMNIRHIADCVFPYPTRGEIAKRVSTTFFAPSLASPWLRRVLRFLRIFG